MCLNRFEMATRQRTLATVIMGRYQMLHSSGHLSVVFDIYVLFYTAEDVSKPMNFHFFLNLHVVSVLMSR